MSYDSYIFFTILFFFSFILFAFYYHLIRISRMFMFFAEADFMYDLMNYKFYKLGFYLNLSYDHKLKKYYISRISQIPIFQKIQPWAMIQPQLLLAMIQPPLLNQAVIKNLLTHSPKPLKTPMLNQKLPPTLQHPLKAREIKPNPVILVCPAAHLLFFRLFHSIPHYL